jgi:hypothetical protein
MGVELKTRSRKPKGIASSKLKSRNHQHATLHVIHVKLLILLTAPVFRLRCAIQATVAALPFAPLSWMKTAPRSLNPLRKSTVHLMRDAMTGTNALQTPVSTSHATSSHLPHAAATGYASRVRMLKPARLIALISQKSRFRLADPPSRLTFSILKG